MLSELHGWNLKLCSKQYKKKFVLPLIVAPQLSSGWQHNYSTKTRQAGRANEHLMHSAKSMRKVDTKPTFDDQILPLCSLSFSQSECCNLGVEVGVYKFAIQKQQIMFLRVQILVLMQIIFCHNGTTDQDYNQVKNACSKDLHPPWHAVSKKFPH